MKGWMVQADDSKEGSMLEKIDDQPQPLSSNKMTH